MVKKRMKTKAKTNTMLEKKLEELECLVEEFGLGDGDLNAYEEVQHRFIFTKSLLAAEILSVKEGEEEKSFKLACMAKRLTGLEEAFDNQLTGPTNEPGIVNVDETCLICSLVEPSPEELQDGLLEEKVAGRETVEIKNNRSMGLVSFGILGFIAGMVSYFVYFWEHMNEDTIVLTPT